MEELAVLPQEESGVRPEHAGAIRPERGHRPGRFVRVIGVRRSERVVRVPELPLAVPAQAEPVVSRAELAVERALARAETNRLLADYYEKQGNRGLANFYRVQAGDQKDR